MVPAGAAAAAAGATILGGLGLPERLAFSTDSRTIAPGEAFVALRGERFDGHAFVPQAVARGASAVVVSDPAAAPPSVPALLVADTTSAYLAFAGVARRLSQARVVAITGSTGKTTTKGFLAQLLEHAQSGPVAATEANENNEIGVAKLFTRLDPAAAFVVVELGARHYGEIEPLVRVAAPDVAVLTNVGDAHLEIMGSSERLAQTKWGLFATGAQAVLNRDDPVSRERAARLERPAHWFAARDERRSEHAAPAVETLVIGRSHLLVRRGSEERAYAIDCNFAGAHNLLNLAAAAAAALDAGIPAEAVAGAVAGLALPPGRYERMRIGGFELFFDAYNASMSGTLATLRSFAREGPGRRIAVLASMAELGAGAAQMHESVGEAAVAAGVHALLVGGDFADDLARGARRAGLDPARIVAFVTNDDAVAWLREHARAGDLVLLKGSRRYQLEQVRDGLRVARA